MLHKRHKRLLLFDLASFDVGPKVAVNTMHAPQLIRNPGGSGSRRRRGRAFCPPGFFIRRRAPKMLPMSPAKQKKYWLLKTEPDSFSIQDLAASPNQTTFWSGVRNYQARNF